MKLRKFYVLEDDVYRVSLYTQDWSQRDQQLMERFGEPEINLGGEFGVISDVPAFELPDKYAKIMTGSPFSQAFDYRDSVDAEENANTWADEVSVRIADAVTTMRTQDDDFTREEIENV